MYDKNLILFTNPPRPGDPRPPPVDIGMGGTPITHPLVARLFWGAARPRAPGPVVEASQTTAGALGPGGLGGVAVGPALEANRRDRRPLRHPPALRPRAPLGGVDQPPA